MTHPVPESHPLHRLFRGLTEHTFLDELGIGDPRLVGYVADLLARFVPSEALWPVRDAQGRRINELTALIVEAHTTADETRRRACLQHIGDFTLFWTGVFPESLAAGAGRRAEPLIDYQQQGKRSYLLASTCLDDEQAPVLRRLSAEFELCAYGLSRVRHEWERLEPPRGNPPLLMS